jgi:hypothetical protein
MRAWALCIWLVVIAVEACSSGPAAGSMGTSCTTTASCTNGLQCLQAYTASDGGCTSKGLECLQSCYSDADCGILGNYYCFGSCGGSTDAYCAPN